MAGTGRRRDASGTAGVLGATGGGKTGLGAEAFSETGPDAAEGGGAKTVPLGGAVFSAEVR